MSTFESFRRTRQRGLAGGKPTGPRKLALHCGAGPRVARRGTFSPPAAVVLDRNSNGRLEWKVKGASQTYHDWKQAQASKQEAVE